MAYIANHQKTSTSNTQATIMQAPVVLMYHADGRMFVAQNSPLMLPIMHPSPFYLSAQSMESGNFSLNDQQCNLQPQFHGASLSPADQSQVHSSGQESLEDQFPISSSTSEEHTEDALRRNHSDIHSKRKQRKSREFQGSFKKHHKSTAAVEKKGSNDDSVGDAVGNKKPEEILRQAFLATMGEKLKNVSKSKKGPCKEPQALAARARRERVNSRMKILQELIPGAISMTTENFLIEAVNHVKSLSQQIEDLTEGSTCVFPTETKPFALITSEQASALLEKVSCFIPKSEPVEESLEMEDYFMDDCFLDGL